MTRERILFISNLYPNSSFPNAASFSRQQITALHDHMDIDVIAPIPWPTRIRSSIPVACINNGIDTYHPTYFYIPKLLRKYYGHFYLASIRSTAETLLKSNKYSYIYASWLFPDGWAAVRLAEKYNIPLFVNVVGTDVNRLSPKSSITEKSLWVLEKAQRVIAVSNKLKEHLVGLGADPNKIDVVYNGVNRSIFRPINRNQVRDKLEVPEGRTVILFVGNLKKEKGVIELSKAFAQLVMRCNDKDLELVVVGRGPFEPQMRRSLEVGGVLNRARFVGSLPQEEVAQWMNACDVFCLPSYMEGQPNVIIEALACQARIVATNVGGIPELDKGQGNLRLIEARSIAQLDQALEEMLASKISPVESSFITSWQENASHILKIFQETSIHRSQI